MPDHEISELLSERFPLLFQFMKSFDSLAKSDYELRGKSKEPVVWKSKEEIENIASKVMVQSDFKGYPTDRNQTQKLNTKDRNN